MKLPSDAPRTVRFGVFELDLQTGELRRKGVKVALQEQPFRVLAMLVAQPGELVTRDALRRALWAEAVFVDFDHGLNKAVAKIRDALGDLAESPRYVETLERRGYRFIAPVEVVRATCRSGVESAGINLLSRASRGTARAIRSAAGEYVIGRDPSAAIWIESSAGVAAPREDRGVGIVRHHRGPRQQERHVCERPAPRRAAPLASGDEVRIGPDRLVVFTASAIDSTSVVHEE